MSVVTLYGRGYKDPAALNLPPVAHSQGRMRIINTGVLAIANGDSIGSKHYFGKVPSSAILLPVLSLLFHEDVTSVNDYDIGLELDGVIKDADLLSDGLDISSAGSKAILTTIGTVANYGKRLWEMLATTDGTLLQDPGCEYDIVGTMKVASTGAKKINAQIAYAMK